MQRILFLLLLFFLSLSAKTTEGDPRSSTVLVWCSTQLEHNTTIYVPNFVATMENISRQIQAARFGMSSIGSGPDTSYGLSQCYGDLSTLDCVLCYAEARTILPKCYPNNGGRIYLDGCFMRAENYSFYDEFTGPNDTFRCGNSTPKGQLFVESARRAVLEAAGAAPSRGGYARAAVAVAGSGNESAYVLADCWKTLKPELCKACLDNASASVMRCLPSSEGRALNTGCFLRYSDTDFLNPAPSSGGLSRGSIIAMVVAIVSSVTVVSVGVAIGLYIWKHKRIEKKRKGANDVEKMASVLGNSSLNFKYSTLEKSTGSFDIANKLGQGGFGTVYKGVLADGREVAVKRLFYNNRHRAADFYNEVNIISSCDHKNLVRLLGCSCSGPESLLVYEFLPNKSLDRFIFDPNRGKALDWEKRFDIIIGTVEGLVYLHEKPDIRIIHRDIKASNILLDSKLRAKIADFGLARSFQEDKSHISTAIAGTLGYMAPEYLAHGQLTEKADVYSFGVLLIEIVCGRQNNRSNKACDCSDSLVISAWKHFQAGTVEDLIDPNLILHNYENKDELKSGILRVVHVGLLCTQEIPSLRLSMSRVLQVLSNKDEELPAPNNPPFIDEKTMELNDTCDDPRLPLNSTYSVACVSHSSFHPR
ncbi:cysteine-rich receptor-like protein kinase 2 [Magnolia sinica]|uniref:cysteine-rich receptor-like protein kinase 2 n=1 Tax=Magnolia sinica TaxID=86752 RepID=UPI0026583D03|nr:cysteine-rich receptor-like protein kinase 2 [Magnolia sinica]XP_058091858.1 cysteine-rich receptor-like protein kinase 2 [Magnolia sinica]XP_058091859.1 cysteine-rich receptor-like protein kinase 2 [Magnolia sinica]